MNNKVGRGLNIRRGGDRITPEGDSRGNDGGDLNGVGQLKRAATPPGSRHCSGFDNTASTTPMPRRFHSDGSDELGGGGQITLWLDVAGVKSSNDCVQMGKGA